MRINLYLPLCILVVLFACQKDLPYAIEETQDYRSWLAKEGIYFAKEGIVVEANGMKLSGKLDWNQKTNYTRNRIEFSVVPFVFESSPTRDGRVLYSEGNAMTHDLVFWKENGSKPNAVLRIRILDKSVPAARRVYETFFELDGTEKHAAVVTGVYKYILVSTGSAVLSARARMSGDCIEMTYKTSTFNCQGTTPDDLVCYYHSTTTIRNYCPYGGPGENQIPQPGEDGGWYLDSEEITEENKVASIKADSSITNHPLVLCTYEKLMSNNLLYGLKAILASFDNNEVYNITFRVENNLGYDGRTRYLENNNFLIRINGDHAYDQFYSRIWLASTFIHEAFHAKLRQKAIALFGNDEIYTWPKNIDDMTLSELVTYFQLSAEKTTDWNSIGHDWMVNNIDQMAVGIREFVQNNFAATYASVGSNLQAYRALAFMGLKESKFWSEEINSLVGTPSEVDQYRSSLNEGGVCSN